MSILNLFGPNIKVFPRSVLSGDSRILCDHLGIPRGQKHRVTLQSGIFICPDDNSTRASHHPKLLLPYSIVDLFQETFPDIYTASRELHQRAGHFNRLDFDEFKVGARLAYYFAAAAYVNDNASVKLNSIYDLSMAKHTRLVFAHFSHYFDMFLSLIAKNRIEHTFFALYRFACTLIGPHLYPGAQKRGFEAMPQFLHGSFFPFGDTIGHSFETAALSAFQGIAQHKQSEIAHLLSRRLGSSGALVVLDEKELFLKMIRANKKDICVPDFLFISDKIIMPLDLKVTLSNADSKQVSDGNFLNLIQAAPDDFASLLKDFNWY